MTINNMDDTNHTRFGIFARSIVVWLVIICAEILHGIARGILLVPKVGEFGSNQIGVFTGSIIILVIGLLFVRWIGATRLVQRLLVGFLWLVLTLAFEILFGRFVMGASWQRLAADYNVLEGGLMPFGMLFLLLSPLIATSVRNGRHGTRSMVGRILRFTLVVFCIFVGFCIWFCLFQEYVLLKPNEHLTGQEFRPKLTWSINTDVFPPDAKINVQKFKFRGGQRKGTVFYLHGNRGNIELCRWVIEPFLDAGYDVWTMDYRGFGDSTGRLSEAALLADAQMAFKRVCEDTDEKNIIVWGRSFGSGIAAYIASVNSPKMLVLETPYWSLPDAVRHSHPYVPEFLFRYHLPTHEYLGYVDCRVHLIHGPADEKIYFESSERLKEHCDGLKRNKQVELHPIDGGLHNLRSKQEFHVELKKILE